MAVLLRLLFWGWFIAAIFAGQARVLARIPAAGVVGLIAVLAALLLWLYARVRGIREQVDAVELRSLVLLHLVRFAGVYLLVLHQRGELPREFALPTGFADIAVATMVLPVVFSPLAPATRLRAITIWNVVGLIDILVVMATFLRINVADPDALRPFTELPLSLFPTFLAPLILASHVVIFVRGAREQDRADETD